MKSTHFLLLFILSIGLGLRIWIGGFAPKDLQWDSFYYWTMAQGIAEGNAIANCCNMAPGYPLFLALHIKIFSANAQTVVYITQAILDVITAFCLYIVGGRIFGKRYSVYILILTILQPLTAAYTGHILTETLTLTLVGISMVILSDHRFFKNSLLWGMLGVVCGYLSIVKMSTFLFACVGIGLLIIWALIRKRWQFIPIIIGGFLLASSYAIMLNYQTFGRVSIMPPYRTLIAPLYVSMFMVRSGEMAGEIVPVDPVYTQYITEYYNLYNSDPTKLIAHDEGYKQNLLDTIKKDWTLKVKQTVRNNIWMWDKYHLFMYKDQWYPADLIPVRIGNIVLLLLHGVGIFLFLHKKTANLFHPIVIFTFLFFSYTAVAYPLINNETRLSLPYYPFVFLWSGCALARIISEVHGFWKNHNNHV
jgi:hypothetical protein